MDESLYKVSEKKVPGAGGMEVYVFSMMKYHFQMRYESGLFCRSRMIKVPFPIKEAVISSCKWREIWYGTFERSTTLD
jgi:hypothetical protein